MAQVELSSGELLSGFLTSEDGYLLCFLEQLVLIQEFARRSLNWRVVPSLQAIYCSPGARAECLQIVFVVIGGRLRCTVLLPSSPSSSSSSRVVYE